MEFLVDYQKALDVIKHYTLQNKLYKYGKWGNVLNLIKRFISERKYQLRIKSKFPSTDTINIWLPQGFFRSPLLFLI